MSNAEAAKLRGTLRMGSTNSFPEPLTADQKGLALQMALKCADIGHLAASPDVSPQTEALLQNPGPVPCPNCLVLPRVVRL